jgi:nitric oxide synthase oxygenase domain/subunit
MFSSVIFIMRHQIKNWYSKNAHTVTDIAKTEMDFITYSQESLIWFALNMVGSIMPLIVIGIVFSKLREDECYIGQDCGDDG